jgi:hypothetical protein
MSARIALGATALAALVALGLAAAQQARGAHARHATAVAAVPRVDAATAAAAADFRRLALHALFVPLVDVSGDQLRWSDIALAHVCGPHTRVQVDGRPLEAGRELGGRPVRLQWRIDSCLPFGPESVEIAGSVDVTVYADDERLSAIVEPHGLRLLLPTGRVVQLSQAFTASAL